MIPVTCDPEGKLDRVSLDEIEEFQGGLKSLGKTEYSKLKQSITEKGFVVPCFAWRNGSGKWKLLDGHQRVRVIRTEGWTIDGGIPVVEIVADNERDAKEKLLAIVSRYGRVEGQGLYEFLDGTGIDLEEWTVPDLPDLDLDSWLDEFMRDPDVPPGDPESVPEVPEGATTQRGDLWVLGDHRVLCGDATSVDDVERLRCDSRIDAVVTDPPYGVGIEYDTFVDTEKNTSDLVKDFMPLVLGLNCPIALTPGVPVMWEYPQPTWVMAWIHPAPVGACAWGFNGVNPILVYGKDPYLAEGKGRRPDHLVLAVGREGTEGHPTPKPLKVWEWLIERMTTTAGAIVFDPFLGSGTTLIAAEMYGRRCFGLEFSPKYVDVIVKRWEDYTGKTAVLEQSKAA